MPPPETLIPIEQKSKIQPVIDNLKSIPHDVIRPLLDARLQEKQAVDPKVGIVLVPLNMEAVESEGQDYYFYAARILPKGRVGAHYHKHGPEPYDIRSGKGKMYLGDVIDNEVVWRNNPQKVTAGNKIEVQENEVHSLENYGEVDLDFIFACPPKHLIDPSDEEPEGDRYLTKDLKNGTPPVDSQ